MATLRDLIRESPVASAAFGARYGERDPYVLAVQQAEERAGKGVEAGGAGDAAGSDAGVLGIRKATRVAKHERQQVEASGQLTSEWQ